MERYQTGLFRRIVFIYMIQALVLSVTGIVDCAVVGRFIGAEGLAGMKLAMPVFSLQYMFGGILSTGLTVQITKYLTKGRRETANPCFLWVCTAAAVISFFYVCSSCVSGGSHKAFFRKYRRYCALRKYKSISASRHVWYLAGYPADHPQQLGCPRRRRTKTYCLDRRYSRI